MLQFAPDQLLKSLLTIADRAKIKTLSFASSSHVIKQSQLSRHQYTGISDQAELIKAMRECSDGTFVYLNYAVNSSSEHFHPYALW